MNLHPRRISSQRGATRKLCTGKDFQRRGPEVGFWEVCCWQSVRFLPSDVQVRSWNEATRHDMAPGKLSRLPTDIPSVVRPWNPHIASKSVLTVCSALLFR